MILLILNFCTGLYADEDCKMHRVVTAPMNLFRSMLFTADGIFPANLTARDCDLLTLVEKTKREMEEAFP
jgi:hypothetical protein